MESVSLSITLVIFTLIHNILSVGLMRRQNEREIFLPEDKIDPTKDKSLEQAAKRIFTEKIGGETPYLEQVQTIGYQGREYNRWSVTINYYCLFSHDQRVSPLAEGSFIWLTFPELKIASIGLDHREIIEASLQRFQNKSLYTSLPIFLLPREFTLTELQRTYESVLGFKMEKKSFRRRLLEARFLEETGNIRRASHRPAQLYQLAHLQPYFFPRIIEGVREGRHG